jgi:hypothetical protein
MKTILVSTVLIAMQAAVIPVATPAPSPASSTTVDGPQFSAAGLLVKPADYRQWPLVGTGLGMAYGPLRNTPSGRPAFTNVFVNPASYRAFLQTGAWPDSTLFILEVRDSVQVNNATTGGNGYFQGEITGVEAEVKDSRRFTGKWAFFNLSGESAGTQIPATASCYSCHSTNTAVDNTFVQFYPVLRDVAREKGTFRQPPGEF